MADSSAVPSSTPRSRVVRSLARAIERPCSRPGCPAPARATLTFVYADAEVLLDRLADDVDPQGYDLCARHAARTEAPRGWGFTDRRPEDDRLDAEPAAPVVRDLGGQATVDVLAAALRAVPEPSRAAVEAPPSPGDVAADGDAVAAPPATAAPRRTVVETLLSTPEPADEDVTAVRRDTRDEPTMELPRVATPRRVPAAGDRGPATDW